MITIVFESHGTSVDNENKISSGHGDTDLAPIGIENAKELGRRRKDEHFAAIFCSDLRRSYKTAQIAFGDKRSFSTSKFPIIKDSRLRECDYGDLTQHSSEEVEPQKIQHVSVPFPNGESYEDCLRRMKEFLDELKEKYDGQRLLIIGHRATQYGLEHWINGKSLAELITAKFVWQPGWEYHLQ